MNVLMVNLPFPGHTNPTLPLTRALVQHGHTVTYVNAELFRKKIEDTGACFIPYSDFPIYLKADTVKRRCFQAAYETTMGLNGSFDLLIYEMFFYPGIDIARCMGIPCVRQFSQPAWSWETWRDTPPFFRLSARLIDAQVLPGTAARRMGLSHTCLRDGVILSRPAMNLVYVPKAFQSHPESFGEDYLFMVPEQTPAASELSIPYNLKIG